MAPQLFVATRKGLFIYEKITTGYSCVRKCFLGVPVSIVHYSQPEGALYAALDHGHFGVKLQKSWNRGETWEESDCPTYPPQPEGAEEVNPVSGKATPWKTIRIWALESARSDNPGELWCGTIPGGLFHTTNGGKSWNMVRSLWDMPERKQWMGGGADYPGIHSICVNPLNAKRVTVAVSCGGNWETLNGGESWGSQCRGLYATYMPPELRDDPNIQDVHCLAQCQSDPNAMWVQHHNGIFHSTNGGQQWQALEKVLPSTFGFVTVAHPSDPLTAWFVPGESDECRIPKNGEFVVTRTRNGGASFEILKQGLPQDNAYDLVYRHGMHISSQNLDLAMGSTTGSLWYSDNLGDSWQTISEHLPPIYQVRFEA
jgi:(2Fe-2S) ferredoxin